MPNEVPEKVLPLMDQQLAVAHEDAVVANQGESLPMAKRQQLHYFPGCLGEGALP